ncbi:hypothetical protein NA57DRAFT_35074 [Rhizodiscina lignyota]|uniref:Cyclin N-terminal domain-containing protein n=1 Tax=Rhizodiscina lignyota TaxID=1504668 RepID=A0A9P4ILL5_9PEZI|nr:hypothetical protein NA57DRAFT_35074 [Rhizodiscina lignyota]
MDSPEIDIDAVLASYIPLSQLPTPPPSFENAKPRIHEFNGTTTSPTSSHSTTPPLLGAANHLVSLLPSNVQHLHSPASSLAISAYLQRADLPDSIIGLTACILESLSNRFIRSWRQAAFYSRFRSNRVETIVVSALTIAAGFLDDRARSTAWWSEYITEEEVTATDINVTTRCVLLDIDYDIHSFTAENIADAVDEIRRADNAARTASLPPDDAEKDNRRDSGYGGGKAAWQHGLVTPEPSPPLTLTVDMPFLRLL